MKEVFYLRDKKILSNVNAFLDKLDLSGNNYRLIITDKLEKRRNIQNSLMWFWLSYIAKEKEGEGVGKNKNEWHNVFKYKFLKPYLIELDGEYAEYYANFNNILLLINDKEKRKNSIIIFLNSISTTALSVKLMSSYLIDIDRYCSQDLLINLPIRSDFEKEYKYYKKTLDNKKKYDIIHINN